MNDKHYNPTIAVRLRAFADGRQWFAIPDYLGTLSHSVFRTAGYMLGEKYMPMLGDEDFWTLAKVLVDYQPKAFLVTVLKSWMTRPQRLLMQEPARLFFESLRNKPEDQKKVMKVLLPSLTKLEEIEWLQQCMDIRDVRVLVAFYLQNVTQPTGFLLLKALHQLEDDRSLLVRTTYFLMKRGDGLSFNLASLIRSFFGLEEVKGTFSLRLQPYELARLATDYDAFCKTIKSSL